MFTEIQLPLRGLFTGQNSNSTTNTWLHTYINYIPPDVHTSLLPRILFASSAGESIPFDGTPFCIGGRKKLECQFGPSRLKSGETYSAGTKEGNPNAKKRLLLQISRKKDVRHTSAYDRSLGFRNSNYHLILKTPLQLSKELEQTQSRSYRRD